MPAFFMNSICSGPTAIMLYSSSPPGRRSILRTSVTNPSGPHHDSMPLFVVHRSHTSSTGALKVRSRVSFRRSPWLCGAKSVLVFVGALEGRDVELLHLEECRHDLAWIAVRGVSHHPPESR